MKVILWQDSYGKSRVRLAKVHREGKTHEVVELSVDIELSGDFSAAYTDGDNHLVIPTDTMKNTVYALARQHDVRALEPFSGLLARHFLGNFSHVDLARVQIVEHAWRRLEIDGYPCSQSFLGSTSEQFTCSATAVRGADEEIECNMLTGIQGLSLMKTAESGFAGFLHDQYTTLADTDDRILATTVAAEWSYESPPTDFRAARERVRVTLIEAFAAKYSPSVQATLNDMATAVFSLSAEANVDSIRLEMPNQHRLLVNLAPFGLDNPNEIFVPTDEPFGKICAEFIREPLTEESKP
ncbi:MAG: urate oxidase [Pirellulales bacterium]